jgi:hypothetical protein
MAARFFGVGSNVNHKQISLVTLRRLHDMNIQRERIQLEV